MFLKLSKVLTVSCVFWFACGQSIKKSNVAFVIDNTGSMAKDLESVKNKTLLLFNAVLESENSAIEKFILITFNDKNDQDPETKKFYDVPDRIGVELINSSVKKWLSAIKFLTATRDPNEFAKKLSEIEVKGGGDCPELSLSGTKEAITRSYPNSFVYVFTDAPAKDYNLTDEVIAMAQSKSIQVNFFLTGRENSGISCIENGLPINSAAHYTKIATATSGEVFILRNKKDIRDLINYIVHCIRSPQTTLQTVPFGSGITNIITNPDSDIKDMSVSVGVGREETVNVDITDEHGNKANATNIVNKPNVKIYNVKNPKGPITTTVDSTGKGTCTIKASIGIDFMYGFSGTKLATSLMNTRTRPIAGQDSYLYIKLVITDGDSDAYLEKVTLLSNINDEEITSMAPSVVNEQEKFYITPAFKPPEGTFKVAITAVNKKTGGESIRKAPTYVLAQTPPSEKIENKQATVTIEQGLKINIKYEDSFILECKVNAYPAPIIVWQDEETGIELPSTTSAIDLPYDYISVLKIDRLTKNAVYKCEARFTDPKLHSASTSIKVEIERPHFWKVLATPQDTSISYKGNGKIFCKVDAWPPSKISWYMGDKKLSNDDNFYISDDTTTLEIKNMQPELAGLYSCIATNDDHYKTLPFTISLTGVALPEIDTSKVEYTAKQGSKETIVCSVVKGIPEPAISWEFKKKDTDLFIGIPITGREVTIDPVKVEDAGVYRCYAKNIAGKTLHDIKLTVQSPPKIDEMEYNYEVKGGFGTVILCRVIKGIPKPDISWEFKRNGESNFVSISGADEEFRIHSADAQDAGIYRCWAKNSLGHDSHDYELTVQYRPEIYKAINQQNVIGGSKAVIPCRIIRSVPMAKITWEFRAKGKSDFESLQESGEEIIFNASEMKQSGTYRCTAENKVGKDSNEYTLDVLYGPRIDKTKTKEIATKGSSVVLSCRVLEGYPTPSTTWEYKRKTATEYVALAETTPDIRIDAVDSDSVGYYKCHAKNEVDEDYHEIELIVKYGPTVVVEQPKPSKVEDKVMLSCNAKGNPEPTVRWLKDGTLIEPNSKYRIFKNNDLSFTAELKDTGNYTCEAKNQHGKDEKNATLIIYDPVKIETTYDTALSGDVGSDLDLVCNASGYPPPTITWTFFALTDTNTFTLNSTDPVITLKRLQPYNAGLYLCNASNEFSSERSIYDVIVNVPVSVEILQPEETDFIAIEGDLLLRIPCRAKGYPSPTVTWSLHNQLLAMGNGPYDKDSEDSLIIYNPDTSVQGAYKCTAESSDNTVTKTASKQFKVTVIPYPPLSGPIEKVPIEEGLTTTIKCKVHQYPTDTIRWYKDGKQIGVTQPSSNLLIKQATKYASGIYTCRRSSSLRSESANVEIVVGNKPRFTHKRRDEVPDKELVITVPYVFGRELFLECQVYGTPTPTVTWYQNNKKILENPILQFKLTDADIGIKRCEANNDFGTIARSYEIKTTGCLVNFLKLDSLKYHPLLVTQEGKLDPFENKNGEMIVPEKESIDAICPNNNTTQVYCSKGDFIVIETSKHYTYEDIKCNTEIQATHMEMGQCTNNIKSKSIRIGYKFSSTFSYIYEVCVNVETSIPFFTKQEMTRYASDVEIYDQINYDANYTSYTVDDIYNCRNQRCCFSSKQLVAPGDVTLAVQKATFFNINVVPLWNMCGKLHNWVEVEKRIRNLAKSIEYKLTIYSGGYQYKSIRNNNGKYINVPDYIWKVVEIDEREEALAIVTINRPNLSAADAKALVFCRDICEYTDWMNSSTWKNVENGYIFCCTPEHFAIRVNKFFIQLFKRNTLKTKD